MAVRWMVILLCMLAAAANAQTRYISDRTIVELRRGPGTGFLIVRNLEAGTQVQVLEQNEAAGYSRVQVADQGPEGWILTRFLTAEPIARDRLAVAERNLTAARARVAELEQQVEAATADLTARQSELAEARTNHSTVSQELAELRVSAANVLQINEQNESLRQRAVERDREVEELAAANAVLRSRTSQNWFILGAAVLLLGILVGLVAPSLRRKRRSDW